MFATISQTLAQAGIVAVLALATFAAASVAPSPASAFTIKKVTDSASPIFFKNSTAGAHYSSMAALSRLTGGRDHPRGRAL
jgi:type VI protein secretion system component Hcp